MKIIKRNGIEVDFDINKIKNAISKANLTVNESERLSDKKIEDISFAVMNRVSKLPVDTSVETIQDIVEEELDNFHASYQLKKNYIIYRYQHNELRKTNTTDQTILSLINCENEEVKQENSNKNPVIISTQRDYMAGEVSKDLVRRYFMDSDLMKAHDEGLIHIHDMDYIAQNCHNCFTGDTLFVSDKGLCRCDSFHDGETVFVKDLHGVIRQATVHKYGKQKFRKVTLYSGCKEVTIKCTANHRWVLSDGSITTNLKVGDTLYKTEDSTNYTIDNYDDALSWCYGFIVGDGCDCIRKDRNLLFTKVRLCGKKNKYKYIFEMAGFHISEHLKNGDVVMSIRGNLKQDFINGKAWRFLSVKGKQLAFHGYYAADGATNANKITTSDDRLLPFIMDCSGLAGYYISSMNTIIHDTNFKKQAKLHQIYFITNKPLNLRWKVKSIKENCFESTAWCVEEPETHTFTINYGIVTGNCDLINLEDMLMNGTVISGTKIDKPHSFSTACNIATQIIAQVASSQYGGQSISLTHLAPFVQISRNSIRKEILEDFPDLSEEKLSKIVEKRLHKEIEKGVQIIQYQVVTLMTTNGQAPFITVFMYLNEAKDEQTKNDLALIIEEVLKQRIIGVKNEKGVFITPAFPKLVYVLQKDNIYPDGKYFYLSELAAKCTAKRLVPDYISEKIMKELKEGNTFPVMGCRSCLSPWKDENGNYKFYGRFNQGVCTINLIDIACSSEKNVDKFWKIFDERLEMCKRVLMIKHQRLLGTKSDVAPILWQNGALARLKKGETIDKLLFGGYSTISLGYAGLYECVYYMTGKSHTDPSVKEFALSIMQHLNDACDKWKHETNIAFSVYGTPLESVTYKFAKCLKKRFGVIPEVTDHDYITNSYHVNVREEIDAFKKLSYESEFQRLSPGGAISYVEVPNMQNNIPAVIEIMRHIYENIMYAELNTKSDYCHECGYNGEIVIEEDKDHKLFWKCPNCGNTDQSKMNVARRTCGLTNR